MTPPDAGADKGRHAFGFPRHLFDLAVGRKVGGFRDLAP